MSFRLCEKKIIDGMEMPCYILINRSINFYGACTMPDTVTTRDHILRTAVAMFGEHGLHGVSAADIARAADVNKALIFYYFGSKEKLYHAAFRSLIEEFLAHVHDSVQNLEPGIHLIEVFVREHIDFLRRHRNLVHYVVREIIGSGDSEPSEVLRDVMGAMVSVRDDLLRAISAGQAQGEIRVIDPMQTIVNILSMNIFFFLGKPLVGLIGEGLDIDEFEKAREDHVIDLLLNGLRKPQGAET